MPVGPPRKTKTIQYFMDFLCLYVGGIDCAKNLKTKINLTELYPRIHAEIKLLHFSIMKRRHAEKNNQKKDKRNITPAWYFPSRGGQGGPCSFKGVRKLHSYVKTSSRNLLNGLYPLKKLPTEEDEEYFSCARSN